MILKCIGIALSALCVSVAVKSIHPNLVPFIGAAAGLVIIIYCAENSSGIIKYYYDLCVGSGYSDYFKVMLKGLGIAFISNIGCDLCRDCGEAQLASRVEFAAKTEILVIAMPLVKSLIELSEGIINS